MTNYYVMFDSSGAQISTRYGLDAESPTGWFDTGLTDVSNKQFKLVNGQVVELTDNEKQESLRQLRYESAQLNCRIQRNTLLLYCDWTQSTDCPLTIEEKQAWAVYRQALRDLPDTITAEGTFTLPTPPDPNYNPLKVG